MKLGSHFLLPTPKLNKSLTYSYMKPGSTAPLNSIAPPEKKFLLTTIANGERYKSAEEEGADAEAENGKDNNVRSKIFNQG